MVELWQEVGKGLTTHVRSEFKPGQANGRVTTFHLRGMTIHLITTTRTYSEEEMSDCQKVEDGDSRWRWFNTSHMPGESIMLWYCDRQIPSPSAIRDQTQEEVWSESSSGATWLLVRRRGANGTINQPSVDGPSVAIVDDGVDYGNVVVAGEGAHQAQVATEAKKKFEETERTTWKKHVQNIQSQKMSSVDSKNGPSNLNKDTAEIPKSVMEGLNKADEETNIKQKSTYEAILTWVPNVSLPGYPLKFIVFTICLYVSVFALIIYVLIRLARSTLKISPTESEETQRRIASLWEAFRRGIFHDMKNQLSPIKVLAEGIDDPGLRRNVGAKVQETLEILDDMAEFDYQGAVSQKLEKCDLVLLVRGVIEDVIGKSIEAKERYSGPEQFEAVCRKRALLRAITNAAINAERHGEGLKEISVENLGRDIVVKVGDEGQGIAANQRERLLVPFERGVPSARGRKGGSGLGMWIMTEMMDCHHGKVELRETASGKGLTVQLVFPANLKVGK